jgi:DNA-binding NarL/FixJ family response regulator
MREPRRLLLADDHPLFRDGLRGLFAYEEDFEVVGEAADGQQALRLAQELMPDVVLMDVDMPGLDGIEATRRLKQAMPYVQVVMLTVHDEDAQLFEAIKAGAQGYLVKSIRAAEMLSLLRGLSQGEAPISRSMAARILEEFRKSTTTASDEPGAQAAGASDVTALPPDAVLTDREQEVLELLTQRSSNKEIAGRLVISEFTVKNHLRNILSKLHLRSRREAARYAIGHGFGGAVAGDSRPKPGP